MSDRALGTMDASSITAPDGSTYTRVSRKVSGAEATRLVGAGAALAWDACGCGGDCGVEWLTDVELLRVRESGRARAGGKRKGQIGTLSHWRSPDGRDLVLATGHVTWGSELA